MKLAEALQERADINRNIEQLKTRLSSNAITQENESPAEDPADLLKELDACISRLEELMERINRTNCMTITDGQSLTALIAHRDCIKIRINGYKDLVFHASQTGRRSRGTEIKLISTVDVRTIQKQIDQLSKELRLTENKIQSLNWTVELL